MISFISRPIVPSQTENMGFPLAQLPIELALDILRLATSPVEQAHQPSPYSTGCALALVSHSVRQVVMPHFLHTIILNSHESLNKFVRTLQQQKYCARHGSRLTLDYSRLVRHVWTSRYWEPIIQQQQSATPMDFHSYDLLGDIFCTADSLGFTFLSHPLLYEVLGGLSTPSPRKWNCKRVTFAGNNARWNPLVSTANGQAFLQQLTHLTIWLPADDSIGTPFTSHLDLGLRVPNWVQRVPFEYMSNLKYFAFSLVSTPRITTTPVVVYTMPPAQRQQQCDPTIFRTWASSSDPLAHGKIININVGITHSPEVDDSNWSLAFLRGEGDMWPVDQDMEQ